MEKYAFVIDNRGVQLSPTKEKKAWYMIRHGKAKLFKMYPLTIQLLREQNNTDDSEFKISIDPGDTTGIAIVQKGKNKNKVVFKAEVQHRNDIIHKMITRKSYRKSRRFEKRYRCARFNNRSSSKRQGRIAPSIKNKKDEILRVIRLLSRYCVVSSICCEDVSFDTKAIELGYKPYVWQYQKSDKLDENIRRAVVLRDGCKCMMCGVTNTKLEVHHIRKKSLGGSDTLSNLIALCVYCHGVVTGNEQNYEEYLYNLINGGNKWFAPASHVMIGKNYLYNELKKIAPLTLCTGGDTANRRIDWNIEKTHANDAICITNVYCDNINIYTYIIRPQRKKKITKQDTSAFTIKHRDIVWCTRKGKSPEKCYVTAILENGTHKGGYHLISLETGKRIGPISIKSLKLISSGSENIIFN